MFSKFIRRVGLVVIFGVIFFLLSNLNKVEASSQQIEASAPTAVTCANFSTVAPGSSVEGLGTIHPDLNISTSGNAVAIFEGLAPASYGSIGGTNAGLGILQGMSDLDRVHDYEFTFGPDQAVSAFSIRMLDYGDLNIALATEHEISLIAYDINGFEVAESNLVFTSNALHNPTEGSAGDLRETGDATADLGEPGNFVFSVLGTGITRLELTYSNNATSSVSDPNHGFADLCFELEDQFSLPEDVTCVDFNSVAPGESVEGLGTIYPYLNISSTGNTVAVAEDQLPAAYGSSGGGNFGMGPLSGFVDIEREHRYTFTFAPDVSVDFFTVKMLDFGDLNSVLATDHNVKLEAYDNNGFLVSSSQLSYISDPVHNPTSSTAGNLQITGDATASVGSPGNYVFAVGGDDIVRLEMKYSTNLGEGASDPNHGLAVLCFVPNLPEPELDPPTAALTLLRSKPAPQIGGKFLVEYACSETAPNLVSATINGYDVINGQEVNLVMAEDESARVVGDQLVWLFAPEFSFDVTCADDSGNEVSTTVVPEFDMP